MSVNIPKMTLDGPIDLVIKDQVFRVRPGKAKGGIVINEVTKKSQPTMQNSSSVVTPQTKRREERTRRRNERLKPFASTLALRERLRKDIRNKKLERNIIYVDWLMEKFPELNRASVASNITREKLILLKELGYSEEEVRAPEPPLKPFKPKKERIKFVEMKVRPDARADTKWLRERIEHDAKEGKLKDAVFYTDLLAKKYLNQERTRETIGMSVRRELRRLNNK